MFVYRGYSNRKLLKSESSSSSSSSGSSSSRSMKEAVVYREAAIACILRGGVGIRDEKVECITSSSSSISSSGSSSSSSSSSSNCDELQVLLIKRATRQGDPWSGDLALPGGKVENNETSLQAAIRETKVCICVFVYGPAIYY